MIKHFRVAGILTTWPEELGVPVPTVLRGAGLPRDLLEQSRILVTTEQLFALWRRLPGQRRPGHWFEAGHGNED